MISGRLVDVINSLVARPDLVGHLVGYFNLKLVLKGHDDLHRVQAIQAEVLVKVGRQTQLQAKETHEIHSPHGIQDAVGRLTLVLSTLEKPFSTVITRSSISGLENVIAPA